MAIVTGRRKRAIEDHFDISYKLEHQIKGSNKEHYLTEIRNIITNCTFSYIRQIEMKGLGHAILTGETLIGDRPFAVILADNLCYSEYDGVLSQMVKLYEKYKCCIVAIEEVPKNEVYKYGIIEGNLIKENVFKISNMIEKPDITKASSNLSIIEMYILTPDIFDIIKKTLPGKSGEIQITDALMTQTQNTKLLGYRFKGKRFDCGSVDGFVEATNYFYNKSKETDK